MDTCPQMQTRSLFIIHLIHFNTLHTLTFQNASSLVARWAAESRVERSILLWGNVSSQLHLISPGCPRPNSALIVQKSCLKPVHPSTFQNNFAHKDAYLQDLINHRPKNSETICILAIAAHLLTSIQKFSFMLVLCSRQIPAKANKLILSYYLILSYNSV